MANISGGGFLCTLKPYGFNFYFKTSNIFFASLQHTKRTNPNQVIVFSDLFPFHYTCLTIIVCPEIFLSFLDMAHFDEIILRTRRMSIFLPKTFIYIGVLWSTYSYHVLSRFQHVKICFGVFLSSLHISISVRALVLLSSFAHGLF